MAVPIAAIVPIRNHASGEAECRQQQRGDETRLAQRLPDFHGILQSAEGPVPQRPGAVFIAQECHEGRVSGRRSRRAERPHENAIACGGDICLC
jgi:hypothetical protein